jgi:hypothetical protein
MTVFQDLLLVSEVPDWLNLLQPLYRPKPEKVVSDIDFESEDDRALEDTPSN